MDMDTDTTHHDQLSIKETIIEALSDAGLSQHAGKTVFDEMVDNGINSTKYTELVALLVNALCKFHNIEESVQPLKDDTPEAVQHFMMELNGFLREFGCPYPNLTSGDLPSRLKDVNSRLNLLDYLISEYQAAQIIHSGTTKPPPSKPQKKISSSNSELLKESLVCLGFPKPPAGITGEQIFTKLEAKIKDIITKYPRSAGMPLLKTSLTNSQWSKLRTLNDRLATEYGARKEMLLKRLDCTIQSFLWSDKAKAKKAQATAAYQPLRRAMSIESSISVEQVLAARDTLTHIEKTNTERTAAPINKIIMGSVPDRGGRTGELKAPAPEMPSFSKRQAPQEQRSGGFSKRQYSAGGERGGERGGSGQPYDDRGRGGRVQGGWSGNRGRGRGGRGRGGRGGGY